ncbi:LysR family transcriptional regulator [Steroidobacter sp. S1-65]|uniref:LysR family transcriptional regulator n=1 Tax=Steroidobacter gossypii TaxID=2805490 RepID=A0ABS1WYK2_9GAMM|nr:LysR family transcriptional regulator [Steroidobacter gossypii]MBM0106051.1 LysR family transcriptional regulator [Steroidobacter gossypii]
MPARTASILLHPNVTRERAPPARALPARLEMNMRQLRALVAVAQGGSVHKAASILHVTQPAVTRAIHEFEQALGLELFERTAKGMVATAVGAILVERTQRALAQLAQAEQELAEMGVVRRSSASIGAKVTHRHLRVLIAIHEHQTETAAAVELDVSQPSVTQALREMERIVEADLFLRTARGMLLTRAGEVMVRRTKLMLHEWQLARDDIAAQLGNITGRIVVGALPLASTLLVPRAVTRLKQEYPELLVTILEGTYESLLDSLRCGDVDLLVGVLRYPIPCSDIVQEKLFEDLLSVVGRKDHPYATAKALRLADVIDSEWVLPYKGAPSRRAFEQAMHAAGLPLPKNAIESNALVALRGLLIESDRLSILSRNQIHYEELHGMLSVLPIDMRGSERPIGITTRADAKRSVGLDALMRHLRAVGDAMKDGPH